MVVHDGTTTIILGMISPYSVRLLVEKVEQSGSVAGTLYFSSTLGSALGTLLTSFYFVLWFEVNSIILVLTSSLVFLGMFSLYLNTNSKSHLTGENE